LIKELKENKQENLSLYDIKSNTIELDNLGNEVLKEDLKSEFRTKPWKNFKFSHDALKVKIPHKLSFLKIRIFLILIKKLFINNFFLFLLVL